MTKEEYERKLAEQRELIRDLAASLELSPNVFEWPANAKRVAYNRVFWSIRQERSWNE